MTEDHLAPIVRCAECRRHLVAGTVLPAMAGGDSVGRRAWWKVRRHATAQGRPCPSERSAWMSYSLGRAA